VALANFLCGTTPLLKERWQSKKKKELSLKIGSDKKKSSSDLTTIFSESSENPSHKYLLGK
jgi:hypothetical protein